MKSDAQPWGSPLILKALQAMDRLALKGIRMAKRVMSGTRKVGGKFKFRNTRPCRENAHADPRPRMGRLSETIIRVMSHGGRLMSPPLSRHPQLFSSNARAGRRILEETP